MADEKLNEVPVVNDIVTILGKRSNGEIVQIDKRNLASIVGELIGIDRLKIDATIAKVATRNKGKFYYTIIPEFISKCTYLVTFVEDRRKPILYTISKYYSAYKSDYNVSVVLNNYSETKVQFYYDSIGNFIIASENKTRSASISIKLLIGDTKASIEEITPSESDLIEIPIS